MTIERDLVKYHQSIAEELQITRDRIRNLIGSSHWLTDGEHKEAVLRKALRSHMPETIRVGTGFVYFDNSENSTQLDILLADKGKPTLFKEDDLTIVTPDAVRAIVEVKTRISSGDLSEILNKLADNAEKIRTSRRDQICWVGLFAYESSPFSDEHLLRTLREVSNRQEARIVDCVTLGPDRIARFVQEGGERKTNISTGWLAYYLKGLAQAYFVSHAVWNISKSDKYASEARFAWFPIKDTAKHHGTYSVGFQDGELHTLAAERFREKRRSHPATEQSDGKAP